jgi:hypothetical protein
MKCSFINDFCITKNNTINRDVFAQGGVLLKGTILYKTNQQCSDSCMYVSDSGNQGMTPLQCNFYPTLCKATPIDGINDNIILLLPADL